MNSRPSVVRRGSSLVAGLGISERVFASAADRRMAKAIDDGLDRVEAGLAREVSFAAPVADVSARYLLEAGGKRVRPMLTLLTAQLGDGVTDDVVTAAEAIEVTHLASLYHDDVMDEAERRRGVPSAQTVWGNSVAILTGDLLFARASQLMARLGERAIRIQADTFERLVMGQLHETIGPQPGDDPVAHYLQVLADKTGSLIAAAAQSGVVFSHADEVDAAYEGAVIAFGERVGIAFQLVDDVIDLSAKPGETGKVPGTDLRAGVVTLPLLKLRERAAGGDAGAADLLARLERDAIRPERVADVVDTNTAAIDLGGGAAVDALVAELREHPVTAETVAEARRWSRDAIAALAPLPDGSVKKALTAFAESIVERNN